MSLSQTDLSKIRRNAIIGGVILTIIATLHLIKGDSGFYIFLYSLAGFLFVVGGFFPRVFKQITHVIGTLITGSVLSLLFFLIITPMGLLMRLLSKDPLDKKIEKEKHSYWADKDLKLDITDYKKQF